jgi:hypothetical protein
VPLGDLFEQGGNVLHEKHDAIATGHEPIHSSKSGACVVIWPAAGRWWCSSCRTSGDAVTYVMQMFGSAYGEAAAWLEQRYGPPPDDGPTRRSRRRRRPRSNASAFHVPI